MCVVGECVSFGAEKYAIARMTERAIRGETESERESGREKKNRAHFVSGSKSRADLKWFHILHMDLVHLSERHFTLPEMCVYACVRVCV